MKIVSVVGARPQFVKVAPLARALAEAGRAVEHLIIHTGQHYDPEMSDIFFEELEIPRANFDLEVGSGSHGRQTGQMLEKIEEVLFDVKPDMMVVYGDTNSTVAGALAAAKLHIAVAHVEAGLRSFNRHMPEEINRVATDHLSDLLLASTPTAMENLANEGLSGKSVFSGDIMCEAVLFNRELANKKSNLLERLSVTPGDYGMVTVHRAENTDDPARLGSILRALNTVAASGTRLVFPVHPRTRKVIASQMNDWQAHPGLDLIEPVGYLDMLALVDGACVVLTDSGGLQKEAFLLDCPCVTLREETEWVETVEGGGNVVVGPDERAIVEAAADWKTLYPTGDGDFSERMMEAFGGAEVGRRTTRAIMDFHDATSA